MKSIQFVIGGCRSGKSRHALELAESVGGAKRVYIATCVARDDEMKQRVERHKAERNASWQTVETPLQLPQAVSEFGGAGRVVLVDCLTLWISNLLLETERIDRIERHAAALVEALNRAACPVILVSNEVGAGIVPENRLARLFRDAAGLVNQRVARHADRVVWMVAGIPVVIKDARVAR